MNYEDVVEGLLFIAGDEGLTLDEISKIIETDALSVVNKLKEKYIDNGGIELVMFGERYKLVTKSKYAEFYKKMIDVQIDGPLSQSALEILAIIAYNEPITRVQIDEIRGVNSTYVLRKLMLRGLVTDAGRSDVAGHPILYKTTDGFLDYFGLESKDQLPSVNKEFDVIESIDLFDTKYTDKNV